ncbi:hypothetical protein QZH41_000896 [Actinostola sp. cb2023]|nr:hypothetical protein QZH41_000896 [Actinostola sp. cb2023]
MSFLGNTLVIYVIAKTSTMRTTTNYLIANMALADLFITAVSMPIVAMVNINGFNSFESMAAAVIVCKFNPLVHGSSMESAIFSLTAISFDRLFAIATPFKKVITFYRVKIIIFTIWVFSILTLSPLLYVIKIDKKDIYYFCYERWPSSFNQEHAGIFYTVILFLFFYAIPLSVMAVVYPIIIFKLWGRGKGITELLPTYVFRKRATNKKVLKMLMTVVITFALCWLTFHVRMFLGFLGQTNKIPCAIKPHLYFMAFAIAHSNSAITPFIYFFFNVSYRKEFQRVFYRICPRICKWCGLDVGRGRDDTNTNMSALMQLKTDSKSSRMDALGKANVRTKLGVHRPRKMQSSSPTSSQ